MKMEFLMDGEISFGLTVSDISVSGVVGYNKAKASKSTTAASKKASGRTAAGSVGADIYHNLLSKHHPPILNSNSS